MRTESVQYLFNNLKNGDFLGFYHKPWYFLFSRLIFWTTGQKVDHIAGTFDIDKFNSDNVISFRLGEQMTSGRSANKYTINRCMVNGKMDYYIDSRFTKKYINLFYLPNINEISEFQNDILAAYWIRKVKYEFTQLPFTFNWVYRLFGDKNKIYDRNCSTAARESMAIIGINDTKFDDKVTSPNEFVNLSFIKEMIQIEFDR